MLITPRIHGIQILWIGSVKSGSIHRNKYSVELEMQRLQLRTGVNYFEVDLVS